MYEVLNKRLQMWADIKDIIVQEQTGFRREYSTSDRIFTLHAIIVFEEEKRCTLPLLTLSGRLILSIEIICIYRKLSYIMELMVNA